ncbi:GerMN domain-containing protein [Modestobacter lapidis]|nr:GerMN domain-containing protein [Modestobacter lapidis]
MSRRGLAAALLALPLLCSCGVPTGGPPEIIAPSDVPYGLASPGATGPAVPSPAPEVGEPRIYLVGEDDVLVPRGRQPPQGTLREQVAELLGDLADGPTPGERNDQISTTLPPEVQLTVTDVSGDTVTVDVAGSADSSTIRESRPAVAQIVLTATSLAGVAGVLLTRDGEPVEAPLPSGQLTSRPLTAADYAEFLTPPPP